MNSGEVEHSGYCRFAMPFQPRSMCSEMRKLTCDGEDASWDNITAVIPDDGAAGKSLAEKIPAYIINRNSDFSKAMAKLANRFSGRQKRVRNVLGLRR